MTIADRQALFRSTSGFDYLRLLLATGVIFVHSFIFVYGESVANYIVWSWQFRGLTRMILNMFFALSGFLVAGSIFRAGSVSGFVALRMLRLVPTLFVEVVLSALVLGPLLTTWSLHAYFGHPMFWNYFLNIIGDVHYKLPGVFMTTPNKDVNSSLWTLPAELDCYALLIFAIISKIVMNRKVALRIVLVITIINAMLVTSQLVQYGHLHYNDIDADTGSLESKTLIISFLWGVVLCLYADKVKLKASWALVAMLIAMVCVICKDLAFLSSPFAAYVTVYLGLLNPRRLPIVLSGDYSYGIYIYGCPVQQTFIYLMPEHREWWINFLVSFPCICAFAAFSWHCIEKPALSIKSKLAGKDGILTHAEHEFIRAIKENVQR